MCNICARLQNKRFFMVTLLMLAGSFGYLATWHINSKSVTIFIARFTPSKDNLNRILLLNNTNFEFIYKPKKICTSQRYQNQKKTLVSFIHSSRGNFRGRQIIRTTFGSLNLYERWHLPVVFLLGSPKHDEDSTISEMLDKEFKENDDLIVGNFIDTDGNITQKHLMGYKWVTEYCHWADYYLKADEGTLVDLFNIISLIETNLNKTITPKNTLSIHCFTWKGVAPTRSGKYPVTKEMYAKDKYPDFCGYSIYVTEIETIKIILSIHNKIIPLPSVDNVFVTGILREYINKNETGSFVKKITIISKEVTEINDKSKFDLRKQDRLGFMVNSKTSNTTCRVWRGLLNMYGVERIYVSTCNSLF